MTKRTIAPDDEEKEKGERRKEAKRHKTDFEIFKEIKHHTSQSHLQQPDPATAVHS
jgi:hypothetical protein